MKLVRKTEVFQDTLSGVCYEKEHTIMPIAVLDGLSAATRFGVLLKPYYAMLPDELDEAALMESYKALGYVATNPSQNVLVTAEDLALRFKNLGVVTEEVDLEAIVARYGEEECDFSNREAVIRSVTKQMENIGGGLWAAEVYTLLKEYIAHTPPSGA